MADPTDLHRQETTAPGPARRAGWARACGRAALRVARLLLIIYLGLMLVLSLLQTRLIFPGAASQGSPEAVVAPRPGVELVRLRAASGEPVVALFAPALTPEGRPRPDASRRPTLLFFYGNGMDLAATVPIVERFRRLGANVLAAEYLGYGMSGGEPGEPGCYATADAVYDHLVKRADVDPSKVIASGWSLGGAVAIDLAARRPVAGLAVFSTFTSMTELAQRNYPFLPTSMLLRHRFESLDKFPRVRCRTLIGHGDGDTLVPPEMSQRLAAAAGGPTTRFTIRGADHGDFFDADAPEFDRRLGAFLAEVDAAGGP